MFVAGRKTHFETRSLQNQTPQGEHKRKHSYRWKLIITWCSKACLAVPARSESAVLHHHTALPRHRRCCP